MNFKRENGSLINLDDSTYYNTISRKQQDKRIKELETNQKTLMDLITHLLNKKDICSDTNY